MTDIAPIDARVDSTDGQWAVCSVQLAVPSEVVFEAVATGEGISSWFVPCALEPYVGGRVIQFADPGAPDPTTGPEAAVEASLTATVGEVTTYEPATGSTPGRFAFIERDWMGPDVPVPPWITEVTVTAAGTASDAEQSCLLTLRSGFTSDGQLVRAAVDDSLQGWRHAVHVLAHRLTHRPAAPVVTVLAATDPLATTVAGLWDRVQVALGGGDATGLTMQHGDVRGAILALGEAEATIALESPIAGALSLFAFPSGESADEATTGAAVALRVYEYLDPGAGTRPLGAAAVDGVAPTWDAPQWRRWLDGLTASPAADGNPGPGSTKDPS